MNKEDCLDQDGCWRRFQYMKEKDERGEDNNDGIRNAEAIR